MSILNEKMYPFFIRDKSFKILSTVRYIEDLEPSELHFEMVPLCGVSNHMICLQFLTCCFVRFALASPKDVPVCLHQG